MHLILAGRQGARRRSAAIREVDSSRNWLWEKCGLFAPPKHVGKYYSGMSSTAIDVFNLLIINVIMQMARKLHRDLVAEHIE